MKTENGLKIMYIKNKGTGKFFTYLKNITCKRYYNYSVF